MRAFGLDPATGFANFTSGGQEANQTAVTTALTSRFPGFAEAGARAIDGQPVLYVSAEAHHSFLKIAHLSGIGRVAVQHVAVDDHLRMDVKDLSRRIAADRATGLVPFMVVATAGTTAAGAIDPIQAVAAVAKPEGLWLHVDAAWGGAAVVSPALRPHMAGIELADSITCDAHKWLSVPVAAGMFFTRHREPVLEAFRVEASSYVPPAVADTFDPYVTTIQWSRRFIGLKLFMTLAELGWEGMSQLIEHQSQMSDLLRTRLEAKGWIVVNDSPLAVLCFTHPEIESGRESVSDVVDRVGQRPGLDLTGAPERADARRRAGMHHVASNPAGRHRHFGRRAGAGDRRGRAVRVGESVADERGAVSTRPRVRSVAR